MGRVKGNYCVCDEGSYYDLIRIRCGINCVCMRAVASHAAWALANASFIQKNQLVVVAHGIDDDRRCQEGCDTVVRPSRGPLHLLPPFCLRVVFLHSAFFSACSSSYDVKLVNL